MPSCIPLCVHTFVSHEMLHENKTDAARFELIRTELEHEGLVKRWMSALLAYVSAFALHHTTLLKEVHFAVII